MLALHIIHRRMAELTIKAKQLGGYHNLPTAEQRELEHCLTLNAGLVQRLDELKELSFIAYQAGDMDWLHEIGKKIDAIERQYT